MAKNIHGFLKSICKDMCGLEIEFVDEPYVTKKNQTACIIYPYFGEAHIRIHERELKYIKPELLIRKFDPAYIELEVLLHEICHYKQYLKAMKKTWFKVIRYKWNGKFNRKYRENVADRYAHYCLKILMRKIKDGTYNEKR